MPDELVLVTGATGLVGHGIAQRLLRDGRRVRALVRDETRARSILGPDVELVRGDVTAPASLASACAGVDVVFHAAGIPEQYLRQESLFDDVNATGARNVAEAALAAGVRRFVHTSTMDVFAAPTGGRLVEDNVDSSPKPTAYERSKQAAERELDAVAARGLDVVYVNPGATYGPAPVKTGLNEFFVRALAGKIPAVPPGGLNVAYVDGVADAHVAAAERGRTGERYLIADEHVANPELAARINRELGRKAPRTAPVWLLKAVAHTSTPLARVFGFTPMLSTGQLSFVLWDPVVDASKAKRELGFVPTPLDEGIAKTLEWLRASG